MKIGARYIKVFKAILLVSMLVLLWQYVKAIDPKQVQAALLTVGSGFGWVILSTSVAYALGTLGWWYCLGDAKKGIPKTDLFMIRHVCETVGLFNPASFAGGDMLKVVLLRNYAVSQPTVVTSVINSRLLMIVSQICLLVCTLVWFAVQGKLQVGTWLPGKSILLIVVIVLSLFLLIFKVAGLDFDPNKNPKLARIQKKIASVRAELNTFYRTHPKELALAFFFFTMHWIVGSMEFYIVLKLFGYDVTIIDGLLMDMGVIAVKSAGAFVPGQIGVEELGNKIMLSLIGISSIPLWLSVSALRRTRQLFWILVGAAFYSFFAYKKRLYS